MRPDAGNGEHAIDNWIYSASGRALTRFVWCYPIPPDKCQRVDWWPARPPSIRLEQSLGDVGYGLAKAIVRHRQMAPAIALLPRPSSILSALCRCWQDVCASEVVHHVTEHGASDLAFHLSPVEVLCRECHEAHHDRTKSKRPFKTDIGIDGLPLDQDHHPFWLVSKAQEKSK